ncbi:hypothetical protein SBA4_2050012 [Candidatus Sulfopaludibacter sp. SbA4]|nr:hypothetical protein SBA4_2050012 [Candidatus Sulfopaludibacter sp. SbA4]
MVSGAGFHPAAGFQPASSIVWKSGGWNLPRNAILGPHFLKYILGRYCFATLGLAPRLFDRSVRFLYLILVVDVEKPIESLLNERIGVLIFPVLDLLVDSVLEVGPDADIH